MNRLIHVRMMVALAIAASVGAMGFKSMDLPAKTTQRAATEVDATASTDAIPLLPTITVSAQAEIPTLPLIVVRPSPNDGIDAIAPTRLASVSSGGPGLGMPDVLPHVRLDMPYYSFGKMLPSATKE